MGLVRMPKNFFPLPSFPRPRHLPTADLNLEPARVQMYSLHNTILPNHSVAMIALRARMGSCSRDEPYLALSMDSRLGKGGDGRRERTLLSIPRWLPPSLSPRGSLSKLSHLNFIQSESSQASSPLVREEWSIHFLSILQGFGRTLVMGHLYTQREKQPIND